MVDGAHGCVDLVVRHVVMEEHKGVLEAVTTLQFCVEGGSVLVQVSWQDHVQVFAALVRL